MGLVSGVGAKEIVASTMGVLYSNNDSFSDDQDYNDEDGKYEVLKKQMTSDLKKTYGYSDARQQRRQRSPPTVSSSLYCSTSLASPPSLPSRARRAVGNGQASLPATPRFWRG